MISEKKNTIAFFDFDGTLVENDSLWPFLLTAAGRSTCYAACAKALWARIFCPADKDKRSIFKDVLLQHTLAGKSLDELSIAAQKIESWPKWIEASCNAIKDHHAQGHFIVIASGSLDIYLKNLLKHIPYNAVICTEMEIKNGVLTGKMSSGNCVRESKAKRVATYLEQHGPYEDSIAYGNAPHDLPMMELTNKRVIV